MRDHLEELLEAGAEALWEADRRLTAALSRVGMERKISAPDGRESGAAEPNAAGQGGREGETIPAPLSVAMEDALGELNTPLPLLERTAALERAAAAFGPLEEASRDRTSAEGGLTGYGRGRDASSKGPWTERAGPAVGSAAFERENTRMEDDIQAERLDRIFRRDSRRYDGGFFLY